MVNLPISTLDLYYSRSLPVDVRKNTSYLDKNILGSCLQYNAEVMFATQCYLTVEVQNEYLYSFTTLSRESPVLGNLSGCLLVGSASPILFMRSSLTHEGKAVLLVYYSAQEVKKEKLKHY